MQETKTIARPYAAALWRHAASAGKQTQWAGLLAFMAAVTRDAAFAAIIADPRVERETLAEMMLGICRERIAKAGLSDSATAFTRLLTQNGKLALVSEVAQVYDEMQTEAGGELRATLTAARPISAKFERAIAAAMQRRLRREVSFTTAIDAGLISGVIIRAGDMVIDASARGRLQGLAATLRV